MRSTEMRSKRRIKMPLHPLVRDRWVDLLSSSSDSSILCFLFALWSSLHYQKTYLRGVLFDLPFYRKNQGKIKTIQAYKNIDAWFLGGNRDVYLSQIWPLRAVFIPIHDRHVHGNPVCRVCSHVHVNISIYAQQFETYWVCFECFALPIQYIHCYLSVLPCNISSAATSAFRYNLVLALSNSAFTTVHFINLSQFFKMIGLVRRAKKSALGLLCAIMMVHLVPLTAVMKKKIR